MKLWKFIVELMEFILLAISLLCVFSSNWSVATFFLVGAAYLRLQIMDKKL